MLNTHFFHPKGIEQVLKKNFKQICYFPTFPPFHEIFKSFKDIIDFALFIFSVSFKLIIPIKKRYFLYELVVKLMQLFNRCCHYQIKEKRKKESCRKISTFIKVIADCFFWMRVDLRNRFKSHLNQMKRLCFDFGNFFFEVFHEEMLIRVIACDFFIEALQQFRQSVICLNIHQIYVDYVQLDQFLGKMIEDTENMTTSQKSNFVFACKWGNIENINIKFRPQLPAKVQKNPTTDDEVRVKEEYYENFKQIEQEISKFSLENYNEENLAFHNVRILDQNDKLSQILIKNSSNYVELKESSQNGIHCMYDVIVGRFYLTLKVLHLHRSSGEILGETDPEEIGKGSFGSVKEVNLKQKKIAKKRISLYPLKEPNIIDESDRAEKKKIQQALREYCFYKIFSMLEIGPKVIFDKIYDIICYNDCLEFYMQLCQSSVNCEKETYEKDLKLCLRKLHCLSFIHKDIKVDNIMFSPFFNSYVLIDFGLTHIVKEDVWEKTQTYAQGTIDYFSEEMREVYRMKETNPKQKGKVNLYLNDVFALKKVIQKLRQLRGSHNIIPVTNYQLSQDYSEDCDEEEWSEASSYQKTEFNVESYYSNNMYSSQGSTTQNGGQFFQKYPSLINFYQMKSIHEIFQRNILQKKENQKQQKIEEIVEANCKAENNPKITKSVLDMVVQVFKIAKQNKFWSIQSKIRIYGLFSSQIMYQIKQFLKYCQENNILLKNYQKFLKLIKIETYKQKVSTFNVKQKQQEIFTHMSLRNGRKLVNILIKLLYQYQFVSEKQKEQYEKLILFLFLNKYVMQNLLVSQSNTVLPDMRQMVIKHIDLSQTDKNAILIYAIFKRIVEKDWMLLENLQNIGMFFANLRYFGYAEVILKILSQKQKQSENLSFRNLFRLKTSICNILLKIKKFQELEEKLNEISEMVKQSAQWRQSLQYLNNQNNLSTVFFQTGRIEEAYELNEKIYKIKLKKFYPNILGFHFSIYHYRKGDYFLLKSMPKQSLKCFHEALNCMTDKTTQVNYVLYIFFKIIETERRLKNYDKMFEYLQITIKYARKHLFTFNITKLIDAITYDLNFRICFGKISEEEIHSHIKELIEIKILCQGKLQQQIQYQQCLGLFKFFQNKQFNQSMLVARRVYVKLIEKKLPLALAEYLLACKQIVSNFHQLKPPNLLNKILPYLWRVFTKQSKSNLSREEYEKMINFCQILINRQSSRKAAFLLKQYVYLIPNEFKQERARAFTLIGQINRQLSNPIAVFFDLVCRQKAYSNNECFYRCLRTINRIRCPYRRAILRKKMERVRPSEGRANFNFEMNGLMPKQEKELRYKRNEEIIQNKIKKRKKLN